MITMPTIIQVNSQSFKYHDQPLVVFCEEPLESAYYVKNPEQPIKKTSSKLLRIEKRIVEYAIKMKAIPICKHCGRTMQVTKVEPYIHENYRLTFQCQDNQCGKDKQSIYYENWLSEKLC
jgi:hypothetical protein